MEKYLINYSTLQLLEETPLAPVAKPFTLGILGSSNSAKWTMELLQNSVLTPLTQEQERSPETILLPADGATSLLLETWASKNKVESKVYDADWVRLGRRARAIRDSQILKEATHLLFFLGGRSDYYEKMAIREAKKGKIVYTVDPTTFELVEWIV